MDSNLRPFEKSKGSILSTSPDCRVCFQQSKFPAAENALQRALEMDPQNYEAHFLLARVYYKTNRMQEAKSHMATAERLRGLPETKR